MKPDKNCLLEIVHYEKLLFLLKMVFEFKCTVQVFYITVQDLA